VSEAGQNEGSVSDLTGGILKPIADILPSEVGNMARKPISVRVLENRELYAKLERMAKSRRLAEERVGKLLGRLEVAKEAQKKIEDKAWRISERMAGRRGLIDMAEKLKAISFDTFQGDDGTSYVRFYNRDGEEVHLKPNES